MSSYLVAVIAFGATAGGFLLGLFAQRVVPDEHLTGDSKDTLKQGLGLIATLTALVLGLLVATTKGTYDTQRASVMDLASTLSFLDRVLDRYGADAKAAREALRNTTRVLLDQIWPGEGGQPAHLSGAELQSATEGLFERVAELDPKTDVQRVLKGRAIDLLGSLGQIRQKLLAQQESSIPTPFLVVLISWQALLFACYGLLTARNRTVFLVLFVCMVSLASALFLVLELDHPFDGMIRVSGGPLRAALTRMGP